MNKVLNIQSAILILILLCCIPATLAASVQDYTTTYTITIGDDGTAFWNVEYRTPLTTNVEVSAFENYSKDLMSVYLPELKALMQNSAAQAAAGTGRPMTVENFTGNAVVQTNPTGKFGVVTVTFYWTHFAVPDGSLSVGDAFVGGLYLSKDNSLIIQYPDGYSVSSAEPAPDQQDSNKLVWYGLRSFGTGEPAIVLEKTAFPFVFVIAGGILVIIVIAGLIIYRRKKTDPSQPHSIISPEEPDEPAPLLSDADRLGVEDRILRQLRANGGEQYQSELVKVLGIPKSTLSTTLNDLHQRQVIIKIKKGRENLIRLAEGYR
ncbi:MAG TPA: transcriptional regulator [Methanoregula sp.]|nr:transcriptional regulator [Methanoregula sp.]